MLTPEDIARRKKFVTATDTPALMGLSPWRNAADVFMDKTQDVVFQGNDATEAGNLLEPSVSTWAETQLGKLIGGGWMQHENGLIGATLDQMTYMNEPVECKTSGIVGPGSPHQWGAEYTDEIPDYYLVQVQTQLLVTGAARAFVPALIGGRGFCMYVVNENRDLQAAISATAEEFWTNCVIPRRPPNNVKPHLETLKRMMRTPGKSVQVADELAAEYLRLKEIASVAGKQADEAQAALIEAIGDAEIAIWSGGEFTFKEQSRKGYTVEESKFRVLRQKKAKREAV
jgi:putative phage-type endonuclease